MKVGIALPPPKCEIVFFLLHSSLIMLFQFQLPAKVGMSLPLTAFVLIMASQDAIF